ncbi:MAG: preprotein translocase subunit YajC [Planctomycetaceae bacterium]
MFNFDGLLILAEEAAEKAPKEISPLAQFMGFVPLIAVAVFGYLILFRGQSAEKKKQQSLMDGLKKNDRVMTIGGIIGTVADPSADGDLITIKVDDGTRMKFRKSAISGLYEAPKDADKKS